MDSGDRCASEQTTENRMIGQSCSAKNTDEIVDKSTSISAENVPSTSEDEENFVDALDNLSLEHSYARRLLPSGEKNAIGKIDQPTNNAVLSHSDDENESMESDDNSAVLDEALGKDGSASENYAEKSDDADSFFDADKATDVSDEIVIDETVLREREALLSEDEKQSRRAEALRLKDVGNSHFAEGRFEAAIVTYTDALASCLLCHNVDRAIIYANRAAAKMRLEQNEAAIADCSKALEFNADYMKALLRRAELHEKTDKLDEALEDYSKALERDPSLHVARSACMRLPDRIKERNEKMKEEMMTKLKDLGNMILRPFGLSTNNFKLQQDPTSGSYSVSFQQGQQQPDSS